jgi:hypothetical protein
MSALTVVSANHRTGLENILRTTDLELCDLICDRVPEGTYTSVNVVTTDYKFSGLYTSGIQTRVISLSVTKCQKFSAFFLAFFSGVGLIDSQKLGKHTDKSELQAQLLSHICETSSDRDEIEAAFAKCTEIDLFIASDLSAIEMKLRRSSAVIGSYNVGKGAKAAWPVIKAVAKVAVVVVVPRIADQIL